VPKIGEFLFVTVKKNVASGKRTESPKGEGTKGGVVCIEEGLTFCRVVGSLEACYIGCSSLPLLRIVTLVGPSWGGAGA